MNASTATLFFVGYFILLISVSLHQGRVVPGRGIVLFRALFPSWKFFESVYAVPVLHYRLRTAEGDFGAWRVALEKPKRNPLSLFFNPQGNVFLAYQGLLQQLESDIGDLRPEEVGNFVNSVSYELTRNLVQWCLKNDAEAENATHFQFKLTRPSDPTNPEPGIEAVEAFLISQAHEVEGVLNT